MSLLDKLRGNYAALGLLLAMGCGDSTQRNSVPCGSDADCKGERLCVEGYCEGGEEDGSSDSAYPQLCTDLCDKVWVECNGYDMMSDFGNSESDCRDRCPEYLSLVQKRKYDREEALAGIDCVISGESCRILSLDNVCANGGDVFAWEAIYHDQCEVPCLDNGERCVAYNDPMGYGCM